MPKRVLVSFVVDRKLHLRMQAEAFRQRKTLSRFVRDVLAGRLQPPRRRKGSRSTLLRLCGLAHGELVVTGVDRDLYGR